VGDTVNVAAYLGAHTSSSKSILIDENTQCSLAPAIRIESQDHVQFKMRREAVHAYLVEPRRLL
jgi:class 3 adenylate cyclase